VADDALERADLERALRRLGQQLDVPPVPATVATAVRARLLDAAPARPRRRPVLRYALVIILLLAAGIVATVPPVRAAVLEFFRIGGVEIHQGQAPALPTMPSGSPSGDLAEAERLTGLRLQPPAELGRPDEVLVLDGRVASLVYRPAADRPAIRLDVFDGRLDPMFQKYIGSGRAMEVEVDGWPAYFADGPHEIVYLDDTGQRQRASARLATATLIWMRAGATYRLEGDLPVERLLAIARSVP